MWFSWLIFPTFYQVNSQVTYFETMGFNSVYQTLKEVFPQVDARLLKAVAIEHAKDLDGAVESVLTDVLPFTSDKAHVPTPTAKILGKMTKIPSSSSSITGSLTGKDVNDSHLSNDAHNDNDSLASSFYDANDSDEIQNPNTRCEPTIVEPTQGDYSENHEDYVGKDNHQDVNQDDYHEEQQPLDNVLGFKSSKDVDTISVIEPVVENNIIFSDDDFTEMGNYVDGNFGRESPVCEGGVNEGENALSTIVTQSGQICKIDLLEDIIQEARNYKDTLFSATESVLRLIEDVEHREKEAEQAKVFASKGGLDILEKVEEIKNMLKHAKEANEMHAGEVYGEKSILIAEVKELQTRLLGLADEKDKSLTILDEMRKTLETRLTLAEEERKKAEREMLEKQEMARGGLVEQELIMEKVVQESKLLQQEAQENAKLRDFLMEKGQVVDELQGEIFVICQDVKSLKEKFDNRVALNKSFSIEQTSFRLASSTSSVKSIASDPPIANLVEFPETPVRNSPAPSIENQTPRSNLGEDFVHKELLDDDWELFEY